MFCGFIHLETAFCSSCGKNIHFLQDGVPLTISLWTCCDFCRCCGFCVFVLWFFHLCFPFMRLCFRYSSFGAAGARGRTRGHAGAATFKSVHYSPKLQSFCILYFFKGRLSRWTELCRSCDPKKSLFFFNVDRKKVLHYIWRRRIKKQTFQEFQVQNRTEQLYLRTVKNKLKCVCPNSPQTHHETT